MYLRTGHIMCDGNLQGLYKSVDRIIHIEAHRELLQQNITSAV